MSNIEVIGLPETANESPSELIIKVAKHAGVILLAEQIESAHRVQPMQKVDGRPKPIVAKLRDRILKDQIISGLRKSRGIETRDIGMGGAVRRFYVNEHLTPENKNLLKKAKLRANEKSYKFVW
ncbi:Zinc finger DNA binding protein, partial [Operophtera brumata]